MKLPVTKAIAIAAVVSGIYGTCPALTARDIVAKDLKALPGAKIAQEKRELNRSHRVPLKIASPSVARLNTTPATAAPLRLPGSNTVLCGAMVYNDLWGVVDANGNYVNPITAGIYTFQARPDGKLTQVKLNQNFIKMRAGTKVNSIYYAISTSNYDSEAMLTTYYTSSWSVRSSEEIDIVNVPTDLTYDPVSGNVYGFFFNDMTQQYDRFCRFDTYYGEAEQISTVDRQGFAIAANAKGEIYGIWGYTGWLIKIDPKTGRYEQIGRTGFSPEYINSLTFDDATGKLYWTANDGTGYSALLEVNTTTGEATEIMHFEDNASFAGIFAMPYKVPDNAPAAPAEVTVNPESNGSVTFTVSCTAPTKTVKNADLAGPLTILFTAGDKQVEVEGVNPGEKVTSPLFTLTPGKVEVSVMAATADYRGEIATTTAWIGEDRPGVPQNVVLGERDGKPLITWQAPTQGVHGGWFDASALTYTIVRYPDKTAFTGIAGTEWVDEGWSGQGSLYYTVKTVGNGGESDAVTTGKMVFGDGYTVPFTETFATADDFDLWSVFDFNEHTTWQYDSKNKTIYYTYDRNVEAPGDDWIISPRVKLEAGKTYRFSVDASTYYKNYKENFKVMLGTACAPASMTKLIIDCPDFDNPTGENKRATFTVDADGYYHIGIYCYSPAHNWTLTLDNVSVVEISDAVPAAVGDLRLSPAPQGALEATLSMTAPAVDSKGTRLSDPLNINIYRNYADEPAVTLSNVTPGQAVSWTDKGITEAGIYNYRVVAVTEIGDGADSSVEGWIGVDTPGPVVNLTATEREDGSIALAWEAPTAGEHDGWFDPTGMTYRIVRSDAALVADKLEATAFVDNTLGLGSQDLFYYVVTPYIGTVKGRYNTTETAVYGPAIKAPVSETFAQGDITYYPWVSESDGSMHLWSIETTGILPEASDQNGDNGMAMFIVTAANKGLTGRFSSPKFDISGLDNPVLKFWMYHTEGDLSTSETLRVLTSVNGGAFEPVEGAEFGRVAEATGWQLHTVALDNAKGSKAVRVMFESTSKGVLSFYIDNISIGENMGTDIAVTSVQMPSRTAAGAETPMLVTLTSGGTQPATGVTLKVSEGAEVIATREAGDIEAGKSVTLEVPVTIAKSGKTTLTVTADATSPDGDPANNTAETTVEAVELNIPTPGDLSASISAEGNVDLTWTAPDETGAVKDDMESYTDWAINGVGDYMMVDLDGDNTYYINKDLGEYPNCWSPKAFQVCNAKTLGIDIWDEGTPHSANKMLMAVASQNGVNNDWLILPRLNGTRQTISLFAKSFTDQDTPLERIRILYSTTDASPASFMPLHSADYLEVPAQWTEYRREVPQGTKWVAINCVSRNAFALFIDDVAFNDFTVTTSPVDCYIVYRDGVEAARVATPGWSDTTPIAAGGSVYTVAAHYADGRVSALTPGVRVAQSGINSFGAGDIKVVARHGGIDITGGNDALDVTVMTADGRTVSQGSSRHYTLPAGIYLVTVNGTAHKAAVR